MDFLYYILWMGIGEWKIGMGHALWGVRVQAPFGAVEIGTGTWAVLSSIPEG